jgi:hypothetical protein
LSEHLRFLVTVDLSSGAPVKVEQVGQAGDLAEVDLASFLRSLGGHAAAGAPPQVVVNIFTSGSAQAGPEATVTRSPERLFGWDPGPPPVTPPPGTSTPGNRPGNKRAKR